MSDPPTSDSLGAIGETLFRMAALWPTTAGVVFEVRHLGEKFPLFDLFLEAAAPGDARAFAFVSVRATAAGRTAGGRLRVRWSPRELAFMRAHPAPTYLAGIDLTAAAAGEPAVFLLSANGEAERVPSLPPAYPLDVANARRLRDELVDYWTARPPGLVSHFRPPDRP